MGTINEKIKILQRPKSKKRKLTWTKNEQNNLQGSKLKRCKLTGTKIRKMNLQGPKIKKCLLTLSPEIIGFRREKTERMETFE